MLARWLALRPKVLIVDEPTRGIDVGAKVEVHNLLFELARSGIAIIAISSELPEVLAISDRIVTMREGRVTGEIVARRGDRGDPDGDDDARAQSGMTPADARELASDVKHRAPRRRRARDRRDRLPGALRAR